MGNTLQLPDASNAGSRVSAAKTSSVAKFAILGMWSVRELAWRKSMGAIKGISPIMGFVKAVTRVVKNALVVSRSALLVKKDGFYRADSASSNVKKDTSKTIVESAFNAMENVWTV